MHEKHRERLRQRFFKEGLFSFSEHEVLEFLLFFAIPRKNTNDIAHRLLEKFSTLSAVFNANEKELMSVEGIGETAAALIKYIPEFALLYSGLAVKDHKALTSSSEAGRYVSAMIGGYSYEVFAIICLSAKKDLLHFEILEEGTVSQSTVHPRKVAECAIRHNAASVILAHNHPSGTLCASENDRQITAKLCNILEGMEIEVVDHIIACPGGKYLSMCDSALMPN